MAFLGQLGAGAGFLGVGLWQAYATVRASRLSKTSSASNRPLSGFIARHGKHAVVALLAVLHMIFSLIATTRTDNNGAGVGAAFALERFGVAAIFFLYAAVALVSEGTTALPLPGGTVDLLAVFAFGEEFALFYSTSGDDDHSTPGLELQYYSLLLVPIGVCLAASAVEIARPAAILPRLVQSLGLVLQGTWFFQMAASLFSTTLMAQGCDRVRESEGVDTVSCEGMSLMRARALATLQFNCHLALLLLTLLPLYALVSKVHSAPATYELLGDSQARDVTGGLNSVRETGRELSPANYFHVLGEDDEEGDEEGDGEEEEEHGRPELKQELPHRSVELKQESPDTNGFHGVVI